MAILTVHYLEREVLSAAADYAAVEGDLDFAFTPADQIDLRRLVKRRAYELAVAINGLTKCAADELGIPVAAVRQQVADFCAWPDGTLRDGCFGRVQKAADVFESFNLTDPSLLIDSDSDILVVTCGHDVDRRVVWRDNKEKVLFRNGGSAIWKFAGDAVITLRGWYRYLHIQGAALPPLPAEICNIRLYP